MSSPSPQESMALGIYESPIDIEPIQVEFSPVSQQYSPPQNPQSPSLATQAPSSPHSPESPPVEQPSSPHAQLGSQKKKLSAERVHVDSPLPSPHSVTEDDEVEILETESSRPKRRKVMPLFSKIPVRFSNRHREKGQSSISQSKGQSKNGNIKSMAQKKFRPNVKIQSQHVTRRSNASKARTKFLPRWYDSTLAFSPKFFSPKAELNWANMSKRPLLGERDLHTKSFKGTGILEFLEQRNLFCVIKNPTPYVSAIVYEFYANLSAQILETSSPKYLKVFVRGEEFDFSPRLINEYFNQEGSEHEEVDELRTESDMSVVASELTESSLPWPLKRPFYSAKLTTKYSILLHIVLHNIIPKTHVNTLSPHIASFLFRLGMGTSINLENLIFRKIVSETDSAITRNILGYHSLIFNMLMMQKDIKGTGELLTMLPKPLTMSEKLLHGSHLVDIEGDYATTEPSKPIGFKFSDNLQEVVTKLFSDLEGIQQMQEVMLEELRLQRAQVTNLATTVATMSSTRPSSSS